MPEHPRARRRTPLTNLDPSQYVTPAEAAAHLCVKERTVRHLYRKGALKGRRVGRFLRFRVADVVDYDTASLK